MEFKEFTNPEKKDYDIINDLNSTNNSITLLNPYSEQLCDLIGMLEDVNEYDLQEQYGISMNEYLHPTQETINKVSEKVNGRHR